MKNVIQDAAGKARTKRLDWIVKQHASGKTRKEIREKLGVSRQRVDQLLKEAGVK